MFSNIVSSHGWSIFLWIFLSCMCSVTDFLVILFSCFLKCLSSVSMSAFHCGFCFSGSILAVLHGLLQSLGVKIKPLLLMFIIFFSKLILIAFFLNISDYQYDITWGRFFIACVMINIFRGFLVLCLYQLISCDGFFRSVSDRCSNTQISFH